MKTKDEKEKWLKPGERIDDLQCRGYDIIQNKDVFCFGMDAVLLADFATGAPNGEVIDLGTGTGVIPMLMQARGKGGHFTGLEVQAYSADMAKRSVQMNGLEEDISIVEGDMRQVRERFKPGSFRRSRAIRHISKEIMAWKMKILRKILPGMRS